MCQTNRCLTDFSSPSGQVPCKGICKVFVGTVSISSLTRGPSVKKAAPCALVFCFLRRGMTLARAGRSTGVFPMRVSRRTRRVAYEPARNSFFHVRQGWANPHTPSPKRTVFHSMHTAPGPHSYYSNQEARIKLKGPVRFTHSDLSFTDVVVFVNPVFEIVRVRMAPTPYIVNSEYSEEPISRTYQYRKVMKPMLERKRRARINRCLDELKELMVTALQSEGENVSKLEKADILELTVRHLHSLKRQHQLVLPPEQSYADRFRAGFSQCAQRACVRQLDCVSQNVTVQYHSGLLRLPATPALTVVL
ncbi:hypothetical protein NQ317_014619 [Molorchus minor]|uniref:BHLH domain-containing protein n=1 Tax=Molorchus minor TaxID=1323400 RepID=A0ABQ9J3C6_9CUCU|nr:hypothetical protein NQ317_014619 [Molorchus minor]